MAFDKPVTVTFTRQQAQILADAGTKRLGQIAMGEVKVPGPTKLALKRALDVLFEAMRKAF